MGLRRFGSSSTVAEQGNEAEKQNRSGAVFMAWNSAERIAVESGKTSGSA